MKDLYREAREMFEEIKAHRRCLHEKAEAGFDLKQTKAYVTKALADMGVQWRACGEGIVCTLGSGDSAFLLRADMDALPVREGETFPSRNGCMHVCGHDMHTAMLLGAVRLLKSREKELSGCVKCMFQPAEETLEGARNMIENGVLQEPKVCAGAMIHVMTGVSVETGRVIVAAPGVSAPAAAMFEIWVQGKGGHGASPEGCIDPIYAAAQMIQAFSVIQTKELSAQSGAMLTIGAMRAGDAPNVIADHAVLRGSLRAYSEKERDYMLSRVREIADLTAKMHGATAKVKEMSSVPTLINDAAMVDFARQTLKKVLGEKGVMPASEMGGARSSGSEDFAYISHEVPTVMLALAAGHPRDGYLHGLHHPQTRFDENALPFGAAALAGMALAYSK
ncbi:MAG: amidohydrolase [Clostridia bacterium]|nr:amidohydrolase [Clostridia bacterium]